MRTSIGGAMERMRPIPLGIRIAVTGSRSFCREVCRILTADPDVAFVHEVEDLGRMNEGFLRAHALVTEPVLQGRSISRNEYELLQSISLVAVIGSTLGEFAGLANAQRFPAFLGSDASPSVTAIKERVLQLRFQEFTGLVNALVTSQVDESEKESMLELNDNGASKQIPISKIDWIRSAGNHVEIRYAGVSHLYRSEMQTLERRLPSSFLRIHRKIIINLHRLLKIDADSSVRQFATLSTGDRFLISRHRRTLVHARWSEVRGHSA